MKNLAQTIKKLQTILENLKTEDRSKCDDFDLIDVTNNSVSLRVLGDCGHCKFPELIKMLEKKIKKQFPNIRKIIYT